MNKILKISLLVLLAFSVSCAKFLEQDMRSSIAAEDEFESADDAQLNINGVYAAMATSSNWGIYDANLITSELGTYCIDTSQSGSRYSNFASFSLTYSNSSVQYLYDNAYSAIQKANYAINGIEGMDYLESSLKSRFIAEARFIRALMHFNLVRHYGGVTVKTSLTESEDGFDKGYARNSIQEVYKSIIEDLEYCEENLYYKSTSTLEPRYSVDDTGRATRCAAIGLLAKVYLTAASYAKFSDYDGEWNTLREINCYDWVDIADYYTRAASSAVKLINLAESGQVDVSLDDDYGYMFTHEGENCSESLFEVQYSEDSSCGSRFGCFISLSGLPNTYTNRVKATAEIFFLYDRKYDLVNGVIDYENTDLRGLWNFPMIGYDSDDGTTSNKTSVSSISYFKYRYGSFYSTNDNCPVNFPILRYADVVLIYAEALCELGRLSESLTYLNKIRSRARNGISFAASMGVPFEFTYTGTSNIPADYTTMDQSDLREAIIKERKLELCGEGHDRFDALRLGRLLDEAKLLYNYDSYAVTGSNFFESVELNGGETPPVSSRRISDNNIRDCYLFFPIPQSEIDRVSATILKQNPGW